MIKRHSVQSDQTTAPDTPPHQAHDARAPDTSGTPIAHPPAPTGVEAPTRREASPHPTDTPNTPILEIENGTPISSPRSKNPKRGAGGKGSSTTDGHERFKNFLDPDEVDKLMNSAAHGRHGARDRLMVLMMYRHGLRVSELVGMRTNQLNMKTGHLWVKRVKGSLSTQQPLTGDEIRAIKRYLCMREDDLPWLFVSERGGPMTRRNMAHMIEKAGRESGLGHVTPHMLRHSCGYYLANKGVDFRRMQDYLGHRDPKHTVRYTRVAGKRFEGLWD